MSDFTTMLNKFLYSVSLQEGLLMLLLYTYMMSDDFIPLFFDYLSQLSLTALSTILKQQKRPRKKVPVDIAAVSGTTPHFPSDPLEPGDRADNQWHQYDPASLPTSKEKWDTCTFVPKTHLGYYCWPRYVGTEVLDVAQVGIKFHKHLSENGLFGEHESLLNPVCFL